MANMDKDMDKLDAKALSIILKANGLEKEIADKLESENIKGSNFMKLNCDFLRMLGFSGGQIMTILDFQSKQLNMSNVEDPHNSSDSDETSDTDDDKIVMALSEYITDFTDIDEYERKSLYQQLQRYEFAVKTGCSSAELAKPRFVKDAEEKQKRLASAEQRKKAANTTQSRDGATRRSGSLRRSSRLAESTHQSSTNEIAFGQNASECESNSEHVVQSTTSTRPSTHCATDEIAGSSGGMPQNASHCESRAQHVVQSTTSTRPSTHYATDQIAGSSGGMPQNASHCESRAERVVQSTSSTQPATRSATDPMDGSSSASSARCNINLSEDEDVDDDSRAVDEAKMDKLAKAFVKVDIPAVSRLKKDLPEFDIVLILYKKLKGSVAKDRQAFMELLTTGFLAKEKRKRIIRTLTKYLYLDHVPNPKFVTCGMKEGMAKSFVTYFPKFIFQDENLMPWCQFFNPIGPQGWLVNAARAIQREHPSRPRKRKASENIITDYSAEEEVQYLSLLNNGRMERKEILDRMAKTFELRQQERKEGKSVTFFIEKYVHFLNYDGEVINEEFRRLQPKAQDMCRVFLGFLNRILALPEHREITLEFNDDVLRALMLLSIHLPHDIPLSCEKDVGFSWARETDLVVVLKVGDSITDFVDSRRANAERAVQPYLIMIKGQLNNKILRTFMVLDNKTVQLESVSVLKGVDWLMKAYFVFNVRYPFGWRNTLHMLQTCFYKIFETSSKPQRKRGDNVTGSEFELMKLIEMQ